MRWLHRCTHPWLVLKLWLGFIGGTEARAHASVAGGVPITRHCVTCGKQLGRPKLW